MMTPKNRYCPQKPRCYPRALAVPMHHRPGAEHRLFVIGVGALILSLIAVRSARAETVTFEQHVSPLLEQHCGECHSDEKQEGGIRLTGYPDFRSAQAERDSWVRVFDELDFENMPPDPEKTGFTDEDRKLLMDWVQSAIIEIDPNDPIYKDPGPPKLRLLTFAEYERTLQSLLTIQIDVHDSFGLVDEPPINGFTNRADGRQMDPVTYNKFLEGAEVVLNEFFTSQKPEVKKAREVILFARPGIDGSEKQVAGRILFRFVARAYRREPAPADLQPLMALFSACRHNGDDYMTALRKTLKPVLASPHFLYRVEQDQPGRGSQAYPVTDLELATRLSYFLWGTMPDEELFAIAAKHELTKGNNLIQQTHRMLKDPRARALTDLFAYQWLQLHHLHKALPEQSTFPSFTPKVKKAMEEETLRFFDELRKQNRGLLDLLHADYTYLNSQLADFYGIAGVSGDQFQEVALKPEHNRGGLLGMGSVLAMTSHTDRTKPTARGKWILDVILGTPPPPPPPDAGNFQAPEGAKEPETFREKLEMHANTPSCAGCHAKLDPLGFALEDYNPVGKWRTGSDRQNLDNFGELPSGEKMQGVEDLRKVLKARQDQFVENLVSQMLSYAIGRHTEYYDQLTIRQITEALESNDYRFHTLIEQIVQSRPFRYRKNSTTDVVRNDP